MKEIELSEEIKRSLEELADNDIETIQAYTCLYNIMWIRFYEQLDKSNNGKKERRINGNEE